ncbi:MAG: fructosamine kinase family protein [Acidimicrobiales bacterium]
MTGGGELERVVGIALSTEVTRATRVRGGDVAAAFRMDLADGRTVFAKTLPSPPAGFFSTEAAGLRWLREPAAASVPEVLAVADGDDGGPPFLLLEWIREGRPGAATERDLGRALAVLHQAGAPCFGREDRRTTGSRGLPNEPCETWAEFYATQRLLPLARLAHDGAALGDHAITGLERIATSGVLDGQAGADEPPARLHGDLWAGNRLVDDAGRSWLIDPAAHGGHREFDLAMMRLFGGFGPDCFAAYAEAHPLAPGWEDRVALHQIAPLVVHAIKFGGGYRPAAEAAIARYA